MKRLLYLAYFIGSVVLVSYYGGNISYLLFYFAILLPVLALLYSLYVYFRFKIGQTMEHTVVKAQKVSYSLVLANEDFIPFTNISLNYFTERVTIKRYETPDDIEEGTGQGTDHFCLLPGQVIRLNTKMYCKYRGTYAVGVKSVTVTDFLGLFTITYPLQEQRRITVRPRIIPFEQLAASLKKQDQKKNLFSASKKQELPDFELRPYQPGDPLKYIHWKNSARTGELLVRKQMPEEMSETVVLLDLSPVEGTLEHQLQTEDNIIEVGVSFLHHFFMKKIPSRVVFMRKELNELLVSDQRGFDAFYHICSDLPFTAKLPLDQIWPDYAKRLPQNYAVIMITSSITDALRRKLEESRRMGREVLLIDTGELQL